MTATSVDPRPGASLLTHLQRERLALALEALRDAGAEKLPGRLEDVFRFTPSKMHDVLAQARSWASIDVGGDAKKAVARDAIGLLWAVMEDGL